MHDFNLRNEKCSIIDLFFVLTGEERVQLHNCRDTGEKQKAIQITAANVFFRLYVVIMLSHAVLTCAMFCFRQLSANHVTRTTRLKAEFSCRIFKLFSKRLVQNNPIYPKFKVTFS